MRAGLSLWRDAILRASRPDGRILDVDPCETDGGLRLGVRFIYRDLRGDERVGSGRVFVPIDATPEGDPLPVTFVAGYPLVDKDAVRNLRRGYAVVTTDMAEDGPAWPGPHPLMRGPNLDQALLHITRALPFIDVRHLVITGGSAGGWIALLLAAETLPVSAVMPDVPVINWAYNATYHQHNAELTHRAASQEGVLPMGVSTDFTSVLKVCAKALGEDTTAPSWYSLSPIAQLDTITCPVSILFTTADLLVPIDQVGRGLARTADPEDFPHGLVHDPGSLGSADSIQARLLDRLDPEKVTLEMIAVPEGAVRLDVLSQPPDSDFTRIKLPDANTQWNIGVIDEGAPDRHFNLRHFKYALHPDRDQIYARHLTSAVLVEQLVESKLARLLDRYRRVERLPCGLVGLDFPEAERLDVVRGLAAFAATHDGQAGLQKVYGQLEPDRQVLGDDFLSLAPSEVPAYILTLSS